MEDAIILYPSPGMGHLVSMVELGKVLVSQYPSLSIIILITTAPFDTGSTAPYINRVSATTPSIVFLPLPTISPPSDSSLGMADLLFEIPRLTNPNLHQALHILSFHSHHISNTSIIDFFCNASFEVFTSLNIPTYYYCPSCSSILSVLLSIPTFHQVIIERIKDLSTSIQFPGLPLIRTSDLPRHFFNPNGIAYKSLFSTAIQMAKSSGIIANTWRAFEPRAIKTISDGLCTPNLPTPQVYYIGPLIAASGDCNDHKCLSWLDSQPSRSVVFLCFGSMGRFKSEQLMDMAIGLEQSGQRFLWVVRSPPAERETEPDLDILLPEGFLERTKGRGLVVKSWAPQVAVLSHDSVGGFVTHCGWNSTLEAVCAGVPMVAWPLYAEQRMNRVVLVEVIKVALPVEESEGGFVSAAEVEMRVRELMESKRGKEVRERVMEMRESAKAAVGEGGPSRLGLAKLVESWKQG
ncbi:UDP-glycosyltransferase 88B1-like [Actinidia eriantha]|uniref:UDP-glycosyltransferase 88B1-like n=1 Tax=Actinidia eriantha TaxID=165200 RepID=UPI002588E0DD|nr:UDP-glycosyltransferase 88B1-like [Actinidia eriantha]